MFISHSYHSIVGSGRLPKTLSSIRFRSAIQTASILHVCTSTMAMADEKELRIEALAINSVKSLAPLTAVAKANHIINHVYVRKTSLPTYQQRRIDEKRNDTKNSNTHHSMYFIILLYYNYLNQDIVKRVQARFFLPEISFLY